MNFSINLNNQGIFFGFSEKEPQRLIRDPLADQQHPRRSYVYAHVDEKQVPFYIGIGTGRRAWSKGRYYLWTRYVEKHLNGKYSVVILKDNLSPEEAEEVESFWIAQESDTLVNCMNMSRGCDYEALGRYNQLRNENIQLIAGAKEKEITDTEGAIGIYVTALDRLAKYANIKTQVGLFGQLLDEEAAEFGIRGELQILDRLTLCLVRLKRGTEAFDVTQEYFKNYRADLKLRKAEAIQKRVNKASGRPPQGV